MTKAAMRAGMVPVGRRLRAYFAPVNRTSGKPSMFDPAKHGAFLLDAPPAPWIDLGWIDHFERRSGTMIEAMRSGTRGASSDQYRGGLEARVEFDFREWGKLQMALAGGSEHLNVLATGPDAEEQPSGGSALPAVALGTGSSAVELVVGAGAAGAFAKSNLVAVDVDYQQQIGYVGSAIAAAYVRDPLDVKRDVNFVRRVTFNVGRVAEITATSLLLAQPLPGGAPAEGAAVQRIVAFVDREGGSFFQEWSALFVLEAESGGRICFYYPRLAPCGHAGLEGTRETISEIAGPIHSFGLHATFRALPIRDENDSAIALYYRSYFPAETAAVY
jgi:hypothetical protein